MRAVAVRQFKGAPELMDLPKPTPGEGEVLVHMEAAGINPFDWKIIDGALEGKLPHVFPLVVGMDGAGTVEALGPGTSRFAVGDGVYGQFFEPPIGRGTYVEFRAIHEKAAITTMPRGMSAAQAAATPTAGMTALVALDDLALSPGQSLLVFGAGGGIGSFVLQLASNAGIQVLAAGNPRHKDYVIKLGARRYFDPTPSTFAEELRFGYPEGVDAILDMMHSADALASYLPLLKPHGTVASTIGAAGSPAVAAGGYRGVNVDMAAKTELLDRLAKEFSVGRLRIPLEEPRPLVNAPELLERSRAGELRGKTVLRI